MPDRIPESKEQSPRARWEPIPWGTVVLFFVAAIIVGVTAGKKPDAVAGRLNYLQFWSVAVLAALGLSVLAVVRAPRERRRSAGFKAGAVWLGILGAVAATELAAYWLPTLHSTDNPFYSTASSDSAETAELPFVRPAHIQWHGSSRGDLAQRNGDEDPYAREITFQTDRDGFHNSEDIDQADLVMIGDSFTEAGNVEETESFATLVGRRMGFKVRNLGRAGYMPSTELIVLKHYGLKCKPKAVIWQITENDLWDTMNYERWLSQQRAGQPAKAPAIDRSDSWKRRSPTYRTFTLLCRREVRPWDFTGFYRDVRGTNYTIRFQSEDAMVEPARGHPGWPRLSGALREGAELCRSNNIQLLVVFIPMKYRVMHRYTEIPGRVGAALRSVNLPGMPEEAALGETLRDFCASNGIPYLNTTFGLTERTAAGELVYLPFDTHLSPRGHEVVAEWIMRQTTGK